MSNQTSPNADTEHTTPSGHPSPPRLNLFALPSLTTLLFALIAGVILVAVGAGLRQNLSALGLLIAVGMVILPLRGFLRQVEKDLHSLDLDPLKADPPLPPLTQEVEEAARDLKLGRPPRLMIASRSVGPTTIGSWRRRYLALGLPFADHLAELPGPTRRALWLHEVAHFANGDHWKVGLARSLLRTSVVFMTWNALFLLGIVILSYVYGLELFEPGFLDTVPLDPTMRQMLTAIWPDPASTAPLLEQAKATHPGLAALYVVNAHLPFVFSGIVLLLFVWSRLAQVREFYADARVAVQMGNAETTRQTLAHVATVVAAWSFTTPSHFRDRLAGLRQRLERLLPFHPSWKARFACLDDPTKVFGSWVWVGLTAGLVVLLLDLILVGPFTLGYVSAGPAHFATLAGFVILALWLLPGVCRGFASTGHMVRQVTGAVALFVGLRMAWLLLNTALLLGLLVLNPQLLSEMLNIMVFLSAKVLTTSSALPLSEDPFTLAWWAIGGGWGLTLLVLVCLLGFLVLTGILLRRLLTWYAFPKAERRLLWVGGGVILVAAQVLGVIVLPPPTALIQGDLGSFLQPIPLIAMGVVLLIAVIGGIWFFREDRRYGRRCPSCGGKVPGWFDLGKQCPACGQTLHPWLLASY